MPFERTLARMALHARLAREMPRQSLLPPDEANLVTLYKMLGGGA